MTVTINLTNPGFASIVTGVGACIVEALDQTPAGAPCRQCLLVPTSQIVWDNCGPCVGDCDGQVALAIRQIYGSNTYPAPASNMNWAVQRCAMRYWVAEVVVSVTRCLPAVSENGIPPTCEAEMAAAIMLANDAAATRQAIACCLDTLHTQTPARLSAWTLGATATLAELGGCGGTETVFLLGVQSCPCPG